MSSPNDRKYSQTHEWVKIESDSAIVGISDHAQDALGDITFVELPAIGRKVTKGNEFGVIESVKAASDLYAPISGEVVEVNTALSTAPEAINQDPYNKGWIVRIGRINAAEANDLMNGPAYEQFLASEK
jgi:glycine cleavage system H protein